jgi:nitrite reductase/ring-hydroxylating ferredoxin subunit
MKPTRIATYSGLPDREPAYAVVENVDLVIIRYDDRISAFYGRCHNRGVLLADGYIDGENLICGVHGWDYRYDTGVSEYNNDEQLAKFTSWIEDDGVWVDADEIRAWTVEHPQPYHRDEYQGMYQDVHGAPEEPYVGYIKELAGYGLTRSGEHGPVAAMGVPRQELPSWDDLQSVVGQLATLPQLDEVSVDTVLIIGPRAKKPLRLEIPIFVSDTSFGALSEEAKTALAKGRKEERKINGVEIHDGYHIV